jgi:glycosyltransferase involved in cell wall biosynthesis
MRITIITSTLNCENDLIKTANSVRCQSYKNIQWIVVDGNSTDKTIQVIEKNLDIISKFICEKDGGIYEAWNKGCKYIDGDWVLFLGAGDTLIDKSTLDKVVKKLEKNYSLIYGNVLVVNEFSKLIEKYGEVNLGMWSEFRMLTPHHQGIFHNAEILMNMPFDESYLIAGDQRIVTEYIIKNNSKYMGIDVTSMKSGGVSMKAGNLKIMLEENKRITQELHIKKPIFFRRIGDFRLLLKIFIVQLFGSKASIAFNIIRLIQFRKPLY